MIAAGAAAAGALVLGASTFRRRKTTESEAHGRARWALEKELRAAGMLVPADAPLAPGRWIVGPSPWNPRERIELTEQQLVAGLLIIGPTRAGKTSGNIAPNVARMTGGSVIVTDPKGELWRDTAGFHRRAIRLAPHDPDRSACCNPIPLCVNPEAARMFARAVVEADGGGRSERVWRDTSTALLSGVFAHVATLKEPTLASAYDFLTHPDHRGTAVIDALGASTSLTAKRCAVKLSHADAKLRGSIVVPTAEMLAWLENPALRRFTSAETSALDFRSLRDTPTAVYLCVEESHLSELRSLTALFWTVVFYQLKQAAGRLPVCLVLDELANIGKIPNFEHEVTINPGRGIAVVACLQARSQLRALYGPENAETVFGNLRSKIVMAGLDYDTGELVSKMLGAKTEVTAKESRTTRGWFSGDSSKTESESEHARRLLYPDDINALEWEKQICFFPYQRPLVTERYSFAGGVEAPQVAPLGAERTAYPLPPGKVAPAPKEKLIPTPPSTERSSDSSSTDDRLTLQ